MNMILNDGSRITENQIEELNANGPYSMAIWKSGDVSIGNEEGLAGRSEYFLKLIRESILKNFSIDQIKELSILDIGCNDGWVLHQLSDLPFTKMVGIEPRDKNIDKGRKVREILKLENSVEYRIGDIESLGDEIFDIVICAGVLYHVESIPIALKKVRASCRQMVFIESRCISSDYITPELKGEIELRDLVYQFEDEICGLTAQKYESAYHDGSAARNTIVNVPTTETLVMNLKILGFDNIDIVADPETYREDVWQNKRPLGGVCIAATLAQEPKSLQAKEDDWIIDYEKGLEKEVLSRSLLEPLYLYFCRNNTSRVLTENLKKVVDYLSTSDSDILIDNALLPKENQNKFALEIVKNWKYSPSDKINLEYGKLLMHEGKLDEAIATLKDVTTKLNSDWRSAYRSFHLLSLIYKKQNKNEESEKYLKLTLMSNHKFPVENG